MNGKKTAGPHAPGNPREDDALASLLGTAGARLRPPAEAEARIRAAVTAEWDRLRLRRQRARRGLALAATVALAAALTLLLGSRDDGLAPMPLATIIDAEGTVTTDARGGVLARGEPLHAGDVIHTGAGAGVSLAWQSGGIAGPVLRVGEDSRLRVASGRLVELLQGRVYLDSRTGAGAAGVALTLTTPVGGVTHIGTQYLAEWSAGVLAVTVREGRVRIRPSGREAPELAGRGERIRLPAQGPVTREQVPTYGEEWAWVEALAPAFDLEGSSAWDFLNWVGRETGRTIAFADAAAEQAARGVTLHGSIDLPPIEAMQLILPTTDLEAVVQDRRIMVSLRR